MDRSCRVKGHKDLRHVYSADGSHRIIYSVHDDLRAVFIVLSGVETKALTRKYRSEVFPPKSKNLSSKWMAKNRIRPDGPPECDPNPDRVKAPKFTVGGHG